MTTFYVVLNVNLYVNVNHFQIKSLGTSFMICIFGWDIFYIKVSQICMISFVVCCMTYVMTECRALSR